MIYKKHTKKFTNFWSFCLLTNQKLVELHKIIFVKSNKKGANFMFGKVYKSKEVHDLRDNAFRLTEVDRKGSFLDKKMRYSKSDIEDYIEEQDNYQDNFVQDDEFYEEEEFYPSAQNNFDEEDSFVESYNSGSFHEDDSIHESFGSMDAGSVDWGAVDAGSIDFGSW
jgi:hypothetical protein